MTPNLKPTIHLYPKINKPDSYWEWTGVKLLENNDKKTKLVLTYEFQTLSKSMKL